MRQKTSNVIVQVYFPNLDSPDADREAWAAACDKAIQTGKTQWARCYGKVCQTPSAEQIRRLRNPRT